MNKAARQFGLWLLVVLATLGFGAADTLLQRHIVRHEITGPLPFVHYIFSIFIPFVLSGLCGLLFAPMVAYPLLEVLVTMGCNRTGAAAVCGLVAAIGAVTAYWVVLSSWVAITEWIARLV